MSINPTFLSDPGETLSFAIQRVSDRLVYDFSSATFTATPVTPQAALTESTILPGSYTATIASTPIGTFPNGDYVAYLYDSTIGANVGILPFVMNGGSDSTPIGGGGGGGTSEVDLAQLLGTPRDLSTVPDNQITLADALWAAIGQGVGQWDVANLTQTIKTPASTLLRTFTTDSNTTPTFRH